MRMKHFWFKQKLICLEKCMIISFLRWLNEYVIRLVVPMPTSLRTHDPFFFFFFFFRCALGHNDPESNATVQANVVLLSRHLFLSESVYGHRVISPSTQYPRQVCIISWNLIYKVKLDFILMLYIPSPGVFSWLLLVIKLLTEIT